MRLLKVVCSILLLQLSWVNQAQSFSLFGIQFTHRKNAMARVLDAFQQMMTGEREFNRTRLGQYRSCLKALDSDILKGQDGAWSGLVDLWESRGTRDDPWGQANTGMMERNVTKISVSDMEVYEPCNTVSALSFYELVNEICVSQDMGADFSLPKKKIATIGGAFAMATSGSSLNHISNTKLGAEVDHLAVQALMYSLHQASLSGLEKSSSILTDLSEKPRRLDSEKVVKRMYKIYRTKPVKYWMRNFNELDMPKYDESLGALLATALSLYYDRSHVKTAIYAYAKSVRMEKERRRFITRVYLPELQNVTQSVNITKEERKLFKSKAMSAIMKMTHAVMWRETNQYNNTLMKSSLMNKIGQYTVSKVNKKLSSYTSNTYYSSTFNSLKEAYPGQEACQKRYPHPKWHILSSSLLLDLLHLADDIFKVFKS